MPLLFQSLFFTTRLLQWTKTNQVSQSLSQTRWDLTYSYGLLLYVYLNFQGSAGVPAPYSVSWSCLTSNSTCLELNLPSSSPSQFFLLTSLFCQRYLHFPVTTHKISETPNCFLFLSPSVCLFFQFCLVFLLNKCFSCLSFPFLSHCHVLSPNFHFKPGPLCFFIVYSLHSLLPLLIAA